MIETLKQMAGSKRFWGGLVGALLIYVNSQVKILDDVQMASFAAVLTGMIVGDSVRGIGK